MVAAEVSPTVLKERGKFSVQYSTYIFPFYLIHIDQVNKSCYLHEIFMTLHFSQTVVNNLNKPIKKTKKN